MIVFAVEIFKLVFVEVIAGRVMKVIERFRKKKKHAHHKERKLETTKDVRKVFGR